jgi:glutaminase
VVKESSAIDEIAAKSKIDATKAKDMIVNIYNHIEISLKHSETESSAIQKDRAIRSEMKSIGNINAEDFSTTYRYFRWCFIGKSI